MGALNLTLTDKGERRLLSTALGRINKQITQDGAVGLYQWGSLKLRLFGNNVTAGKATVAGDLTESTITGYSEIDIRPIDFVRKESDSDTTNTVYSKEYQFDFTGSGTVYGAMVVEGNAAAAGANVDTIVAEADVAGSLGGKAFLFWSNDTGGNYVWFNTGASSDPAIEYSGESLGSIVVNISVNDTASTIGGLVRSAITTADVGATISGATDTIIITMDNPGPLPNEVQDDEDNGTGWSSFTNTTPGVPRFVSGTNELSKVVTTAGTSLGGKYFGFSCVSGLAGDVSAYIWYNTGSSMDPEPDGYILGFEVAINTGDTAVQIATKTAAAIYDGGFESYDIVPVVADGDTLYIESISPGAIDATVAGDSGFTVTQLVDSSDTGVVWFAGNFPSALSVINGDDVKITLQLTIN